MLNGSTFATTVPLKAKPLYLAPLVIEHDASPVYENASVVLVGGHDLAFEGLKTLLGKHDFNIVAEGRRLREIAIPDTFRARRFLIIFDVVDELDPVLDEIALIRQHFPLVCIVALLEAFQKAVGHLRHSVDVNAILDRNVSCEALVKTLRVVMTGYGVLTPIVTDTQVADDTRARRPGSDTAQSGAHLMLSDREFEIIRCLAEGQSNKVIARRFSISEATVKIHVRGILRKVNARNRTQAAMWALNRGFGSSAVAID